MSYSFFGTCLNDYEQLMCCLKTILNQTILPKQIIIVNSGDRDIKRNILNQIDAKYIELVYILKKMPRVSALNIALNKSNSDYSLRFDTRSRFNENYAFNALKVLNDENINAKVVGGVPSIISESNSFESKLCGELMSRSYIFFYPKHRNIKYSGYASSIYLGCFKTDLLRKIKYREKISLLSEDSLIISDFIERGLQAYISSSIKVSYINRSSFKNLLKLFNTYGYCRANTIFVSKKLFISSRHFLVCILIFFITLFLFNFSFKSIFCFPLFIFIFNCIGEIKFFRNGLKMYLPFYATLCQFSWIVGFFWNLITIFKRRENSSNFIS